MSTRLKEVFKNLKKVLTSYTQGLAKNSKKRWTIIIGFILLVVGIFVYANLGLFISAFVNGQPITRWQLIAELEKQGGKQILDSIVTQKLIYQEAKKSNVVVTPEDVDNEIVQIENQLKAQGTDLDTALAFQGQTRADLSESLKLKIIVERLIADKISISDEDIKIYFEQNRETFEKNIKLEDVKNSIISTLRQQKMSDEYQKWLSEIKSKANIKYLVNF